MTEKNITKLSLSEIKKLKGQTRPDAPDGPELDADFWAKAEIVEPQAKQSVHLRVDPDILEYFRAQGKGHLTRMHAVLRSYVDAHHAK